MWGCSMRFSWIMERPPSAPPKEGSTSLEPLLKTRNEFVCMLMPLISSKIFYDILRCRLRRGGLKCKRSAPNGNLPRPIAFLVSLAQRTATYGSQGGGHLLAVFHDYALCIVRYELSQGEHFLAVL